MISTVVLPALCGLVYLVVWSDAIQFSKYEMETFACDIQYGHVTATTQAHSVIHCGVLCEHTSDCQSSLFSVLTGACHLNSQKRKCETVQGGCGKEIKYIKKEAEPTTVLGPCVTDADCSSILCENKVDACGICITGKCTCPQGSHYNIIDNTCRLGGCGTYDDTFDFFIMYPSDYSDGTTHSPVTFRECKELCLCESDFTCVWFTYHADSELCTYTSINNNGLVEGTGRNAEHYSRNCADL